MESTGLSVQEKKRKIDFQDGGHGGHLGFPIGTILGIFDLQVIPMLPSKFGVNWPSSSGEEEKNRCITCIYNLSPFFSIVWGLMTRLPLWVILCRLPEKGRKEIDEIVEEMKERTVKKEEQE